MIKINREVIATLDTAHFHQSTNISDHNHQAHWCMCPILAQFWKSHSCRNQASCICSRYEQPFLLLHYCRISPNSRVDGPDVPSETTPCVYVLCGVELWGWRSHLAIGCLFGLLKQQFRGHQSHNNQICKWPNDCLWMVANPRSQISTVLEFSNWYDDETHWCTWYCAET